MNALPVLSALAPLHALAAGIVALLLLELVGPRTPGATLIAALATLTAAGSALALHGAAAAAVPFPGHYAVGPAVFLVEALLCLLALPVIVMSRQEFAAGRYYALLLASLYGACLLPGAQSFTTLFLALELMSMPVYALVLMTFRRDDSAEAALKYLVLGGAATATLLLGISFLYGGTGSLALGVFATAIAGSDPVALTGVALILAALFLKAAVVPLHGWAPDAYQAASVPVTAYMATLIKAGVLLAALRLIGAAPLAAPVVALLAVLPLASMVWGNLAAMRQVSFRRLIAYSSIAHAGYLFFAFLGDGAGRQATVLFYLATYGVMTLLAFAALPGGEDEAAADGLDAFAGLYRRRPAAALAIAAAMLSLAGLPPLPGFVAKFLVFRNVLAGGHPLLAVAGLLASYLGLYLYLRVIARMFMAEDGAADGRGRRYALLAALLCALPALGLALYPGWLLERL